MRNLNNTEAAGEHGYATSLPPTFELESLYGASNGGALVQFSTTTNPTNGLVNFRHRSNSSMSSASSTASSGSFPTTNLKRLNSTSVGSGLNKSGSRKSHLGNR